MQDELRYQIDYEYHHPYSSFNSYFLGRKIVDKTLSFLFIRLFLNYNQPYKHQNVIFRLAFSRIFIILIFKKSLGSSHYPNIIPADCIYDWTPSRFNSNFSRQWSLRKLLCPWIYWPPKSINKFKPVKITVWNISSFEVTLNWLYIFSWFCPS